MKRAIQYFSAFSLSIFYIIVVIEPYEGINYDEINVYEVYYGYPAEDESESEDYSDSPEEESLREVTDYLIFR